MIMFWYIASCIAGAIIIGIRAPSAIDNTEVTDVSSIPFANLPIVLAVHGYTTIKSDVLKLAILTCSNFPESSDITEFPLAHKK